jgi:pimeloyl-ACP methyl ester carboxylesterase
MDNLSGFQRHKIPTKHGGVSVLTRGGAGPAIMLLHGNSFSGDVFSGMANDPAFAGIPLIIPDLPGHGLSDNAPVPSQTYSYAGFGDCITELATALKLQSYMIFGWSLGGQIAIEMLDRAPGLIGVATIGSAIVPRGPLGLINGFHFSLDLLLAGKAAFSTKEAMRFAETCTGTAPSTLRINSILRVDPAMRPALSKSSVFGKGRDQRAVIANTQTPVYLTLGENDPFIRTEHFSKTTGPTLFGDRPQIFTGNGHAPFLENPSSFARRLAVFYRHVEVEAALPKYVEEPIRLAS